MRLHCSQQRNAITANKNAHRNGKKKNVRWENNWNLMLFGAIKGFFSLWVFQRQCDCIQIIQKWNYHDDHINCNKTHTKVQCILMSEQNLRKYFSNRMISWFLLLLLFSGFKCKIQRSTNGSLDLLSLVFFLYHKQQQQKIIKFFPLFNSESWSYLLSNRWRTSFII